MCYDRRGLGTTKKQSPPKQCINLIRSLITHKRQACKVLWALISSYYISSLACKRNYAINDSVLNFKRQAQEGFRIPVGTLP